MAWTPPKPAGTYDTLVKQFGALCAFTASIEAQLRYHQMDEHRETQARAQVDGERAANAILTAEIERLQLDVEELRGALREYVPDHPLASSK